MRERYMRNINDESEYIFCSLPKSKREGEELSTYIATIMGFPSGLA
jgi:hypothetical protein